MPPKKKKQPNNPFYYFMLDFQAKQGKKFKSLAEVATAAGPIWEGMSQEQRKPYEEKASKLKQGRLTSDGRNVEELEKQQLEEQNRLTAMKDDIHSNIEMLYKSNRLENENFYIIAFNNFCYWETQDTYYPAEVAITGFSLKNGVTPDNIFHRMIKPGALPRGFAAEAKSISKETHNIDPPLHEDNTCNMEEVSNELTEFLEERKSDNHLPILYTAEKHLKMVQKIMNSFSAAYHNNKYLFKIFSLESFFRILKNTVDEENTWISETFSAREIERDTFAYTPGISCQFHESTERMVYCVKAITTRYAYIICDNCCRFLNIELVPGYHVPGLEKIFDCAKSTSSRSRSSRSIRDDDTQSVSSFTSRSDWESESMVSCDLDPNNFPAFNPGRNRDPRSLGNSVYTNSGPWQNFRDSDAESVSSYSSAQNSQGSYRGHSNDFPALRGSVRGAGGRFRGRGGHRYSPYD